MNKKNRIPAIDDYLKASEHPLRQMGGCRSVIKKESSLGRPLVTVYTIVKNRKATLAQTILSVLNQTYSNVEYIVIDGASTDGTLEVIKQFDNRIDVWISEPDYGTSDADNKAISLARGDIIFWLSSDDWIDPGFIEKSVQSFLKSEADFIFGDMIMYKAGEATILYKGNKDYAALLMSGDPCFNYPSMVIKKRCFQAVGLFDANDNYASDLEWLLRLHQSGGKGYYEDALIVHRRVGGRGESHPIKGILEQLRVLDRYRLPKTKALIIFLHYFICTSAGSLIRLLLPNAVYRKIKRIVHKS